MTAEVLSDEIDYILRLPEQARRKLVDPYAEVGFVANLLYF